MATFTPSMYGQYPLMLASGKSRWVEDAHNVRLLASAYTYNQDTHDYADDLTNELATAGGYTAGGQVIANRTRTYDSATNTTKLDGDDSVWTSSTLTWRYAVVVAVATGVASTSPLCCINSGDVDTSSTGGTTTVIWNAAGIMTLVAT